MAVTAIRYDLTKWVESLKKGIFTATMEWELQVTISQTIRDMAPSNVAAQFDLPFEGTNYKFYNLRYQNASCRGASCEQIAGGVYSYKTEWSDENAKQNEDGDDSQSTDENPLNDLPIIKPVGGMRERAITKDRLDKAILNKAGDPVIQSIEDNTINIAVTCNVAVNSGVESLVVALRNRVNIAPIRVGRWYIDTNMARVIFESGFLSEVKRRNDTEYLEFSFLISVDERDYHRGTSLNAGFRQKVWTTSGGTPIAPASNPNPLSDIYTVTTILSGDGSEPSEPVPLDDFGREIVRPQPDEVLYLDTNKYQEADFTYLPGVFAWAGP
jgi:hypothetical protein